MAELKVSILGPQIGKNWGSSPLNFLGTRSNTPIGDKLFQNMPRRVAKFSEK